VNPDPRLAAFPRAHRRTTKDASIVTLLKLANTLEEFKNLDNKVHPRLGDTLSLEI
jgi:hypothetical protein